MDYYEELERTRQEREQRERTHDARRKAAEQSENEWQQFIRWFINEARNTQRPTVPLIVKYSKKEYIFSKWERTRWFSRKTDIQKDVTVEEDTGIVGWLIDVPDQNDYNVSDILVGTNGVVYEIGRDGVNFSSDSTPRPMGSSSLSRDHWRTAMLEFLA
jgi:hypothetical protein